MDLADYFQKVVNLGDAGARTITIFCKEDAQPFWNTPGFKPHCDTDIDAPTPVRAYCSAGSIVFICPSIWRPNNKGTHGTSINGYMRNRNWVDQTQAGGTPYRIEHLETVSTVLLHELFHAISFSGRPPRHESEFPFS